MALYSRLRAPERAKPPPLPPLRAGIGLPAVSRRLTIARMLTGSLRRTAGYGWRQQFPDEIEYGVVSPWEEATFQARMHPILELNRSPKKVCA